MSYKDLTPSTVIEYIKANTDIFPAATKLEVYEVGGGETTAMVLSITSIGYGMKQGDRLFSNRPNPTWLLFGEGAPLTAKRNQMESEMIKLKTAITPEYLPEMYHLDPDNNLFIYEDCGRLKIMRFELTKGETVS